jgi:hypothetical protein
MTMNIIKFLHDDDIAKFGNETEIEEIDRCAWDDERRLWNVFFLSSLPVHHITSNQSTAVIHQIKIKSTARKRQHARTHSSALKHAQCSHFAERD